MQTLYFAGKDLEIKFIIGISDAVEKDVALPRGFIEIAMPDSRHREFFYPDKNASIQSQINYRLGIINDVIYGQKKMEDQKPEYVIVCQYDKNYEPGDAKGYEITFRDEWDEKKVLVKGRLLWIRNWTWGDLEGTMLEFYSADGMNPCYFSMEDIRVVYEDK